MKLRRLAAVAFLLAVGTTYAVAQAISGGSAPIVFPGTYPSATSGASGIFTSKGYSTTVAPLFAAVASGHRQMAWWKNQGAGLATLCPANVASPAAGAGGCIDVPAGQSVNLCSATTCPDDAWSIVGALVGNGTLAVQ